MYLQGKVWRDGKFWLIEIEILDVMTQGKTKREAYKMLKDAIELLVNKKGFKVTVLPKEGSEFFIKASNEQELIAFMLKQQRIKNHLTIQEITHRLRVNSINAYAQYEQGKSLPSLTKIQKFLSAMNRNLLLTLNLMEDPS